MKWEYSKSPKVQHKESGIYLPFLALILVAFLAVCGLAVDGGALFVRRGQMQKAADLAAQAGLGYRALKGWGYFHDIDPATLDELYTIGAGGVIQANLDNNGPKDDEVRQRAIEVARENVRALGLDLATAQIRAYFGDNVLPTGATAPSPYGTSTDRIRVEIDLLVPLGFMGVVPGLDDCTGGDGCWVRVASEVQLQPANIMLALDISGSMGCPDNDTDDPPCQCRTDPDNPNCSAIPLADTKIGRLVANDGPLWSFVRYFNPNRDRIGIVPYHTTAAVALPIITPANIPINYGAQLAQMVQAIPNLSPRGNTNSTDGLWRAFQNISKATNPQIVGKSPFFVLLFSDGADTAGRFSFAADAIGPMMQEKLDLGATNDWTSYKVEWRDVDNNAWYGPSPLVNTSDIPFEFLGGEPDGGWTVCGQKNPMFSDPNSFHQQWIETDVNGNPQPCLQSFEFLAAEEPNHPVALNSGDQLDEAEDFAAVNGANPSYYYMQHYYHGSVEVADKIRASGGLVYAVGLGPQGAIELGGTLNSDPHQNILRDFEQKSFFFERLTADVYSGYTQPLAEYGQAHPSFDERNIVINDPKDPRNGKTVQVGYAEHRNWDWVQSNVPRELRGEYLQAQNVAQVEAQFTRIAKQILMRLIQ